MPVIGQRWISTSEPQLGLGTVIDTPHRQVQIHFPAAEETRLYALDSAPLVRVRFKPGDEIRRRDGSTLRVERVEESRELLTYVGSGLQVPEAELLDSLSFTSPEDRLLAGLCDDPRDFDLRGAALQWNSALRQSPARGLRGSRIDLIPHQLAIVAEACLRPHPRLLLADEVGLGKTIEACLILQHLHLTGRADRVLVLVPEPLVHQWFVELMRRFHLLFTLLDESRCEASPDSNPFEDAQLILAPISLFRERALRLEQAREAGFDLMIVDEAHHLEWAPLATSPEYALVEALASEIPSLLLLTATPQQLGAAGHFARLRLLDPHRYHDLTTFIAETESYAPLASLIETLDHGEVPQSLGSFERPDNAALLQRLHDGDEEARDPLIQTLLDGVGTGRVLFRNTRRKLKGFPQRQAHLDPLPPGTDPYHWLAERIRSLPESEKILLITGSPEAAIRTREKLLEAIHVETALFHEDLSLIERDRHAAWFADPAGARILISSEIGSEGRNFQFARHLILLGLPTDPELLEQRIGRLDRIGQTGTIHIHVPYGAGGPSERIARWFDEGLDAFTRPLRGATALADELLPELQEAEDFEAFLEKTRTRAAEVARELDSGHDRLLERSAPPAEKAATLIEEISRHNRDAAFEKFTIRLFDHLGLDVSDHSPRTYHLARGQRLGEAFADLPEDGLTATFDRATALAREDLDFLSADHPQVRGALDSLIHSELGNASFAHWETGRGKGVLLEARFVLETLAPARLHLDRFLPPIALEAIVNHRGGPIEAGPPRRQLKAGDPRRLVGQATFRKTLFPTMKEALLKAVDAKASARVAQAERQAADELHQDLRRLRSLATRNPQVRPEEIQALETQLAESLDALRNARLRLDSLRLIWQS